MDWGCMGVSGFEVVASFGFIIELNLKLRVLGVLKLREIKETN